MKEALNALSPKSAMLVGLVGGVLVICTIGFFVLLVLVLGSNAGLAQNAPSYNNANVPTPSVPTVETDNGVEPAAVQLATITDKDHIRGNKNAPITIIEFSDTECPFCKRFHPTIQQVINTYGDKVRWVYKHYPLDGLHPKARKEAEATECAAELGGNDGFWKYLDRLFEVTPANNGLDLAQLPRIAEDVGLNRKKFEECLNSGRHASVVSDHVRQAEAAGARGTPYPVVVFGDQKIPLAGAVPFEQLKAIIDPLLQ